MLRRRRVVPGPEPGGAALCGRSRELDALRGWLDAAGRSRGRLVLCTGEPGIGKTRLAQELAATAAAGGGGVAWGRCGETHGTPPFWPWRQVLRTLRTSTGAPADHDLPPGDAASSEDRFRVVEAVTRSVLREAARRPLLVVLDDVQWSDEPSLLVLRHLADQAVAAPLLLLATLRDVESGEALVPALTDLYRAPAVELVELRGLGPTDVGRQLAALGAGADDRRVHEILDATGGNPFFVREVARAIAEGTWHPGRAPRTVRDVVGARVGRLSAECRHFVQAGAVVGRQFAPAVVADMLGVPVERCLGAADAVVRSGLVTQVGGGELRFAHELTRDAVRSSVATFERVALHRAAADALESHWAGELDDHLAELAWHRLAVAAYGTADEARRWALRAADRAVRHLAFEEAVRLCTAALAVPAPWADDVARCRAQLALGRAAYLAGDLDAAVSAAAEAARVARSADRPELIAEAALVLEPAADPAVNAAIAEWCGEALTALDEAPLARRSGTARPAVRPAQPPRVLRG